MLRTETPTTGIAGASTLCLANGAARRSPPRGSPLGRYAVRPPLTPSLNLNSAIVRTTTWGSGCAHLCEYETTPQITGASMGTVRQAEIDQHSQKLGMRRMSDNARLSGIPEPHQHPSHQSVARWAAVAVEAIRPMAAISPPGTASTCSSF